MKQEPNLSGHLQSAVDCLIISLCYETAFLISDRVVSAGGKRGALRGILCSFTTPTGTVNNEQERFLMLR